MVTRTRSRAGLALLTAAFAASTARAQPEPTSTAEEPAEEAAASERPVDTAASAPAPTPLPAVHHAPVTIARAGHSLVLTADIEGPDVLRRAIVAYRLDGEPQYREVELQRSAGRTTHAAEIPAELVKAPSLVYAIELELTDGRKVEAFATRSAPHRVSVPDDYLDLREQALLERLGGRRSLVSTRAEYVRFAPLGARLADAYLHVEGAYTYRLLRAVTEFSVKAGALRGVTPSFARELETGMYYTAPGVTLRFADPVHVALEGITAVTDTGFAVGAGGELMLGDLYGSKLAVGAQWIDGFGTRLWSRVDITATDRLTLTPVVEATDFPNADRFGVRLTLQSSLDVGSGIAVSLRGGYQARQAEGGGPSGGLGLSYGF